VSDAAETAANDRNLVVLRDPDELPPILAGHLTSQLRARAQSFYAGIAELFERWVARRPSHHTQRAYRRDVLSFVDDFVLTTGGVEVVSTKRDLEVCNGPGWVRT
jgi:hypothetical protein